MWNTASIGSVLLLGALSACSGDTSRFSERFVAACAETTNMGPGICDCLANRAEAELSEDARSLILASLEGDEQAIEAARSRLGVAEGMQAGMFMTQAGACAQELGELGGRAP